MIDDTFESKVLACIYRSRDFCAVAGQFVRPSYFTGPVRHNMAKLAIEFYQAYQTNITGHAFSLGLQDLAKAKKIKPADGPTYAAEFKRLAAMDITDERAVLDRLIKFVQDREMRAFIEDAVSKKLPKEDFDGLRSEMQRLMEISVNATQTPYDYWADATIDARAKSRADSLLVRSVGISTGIKKLDDSLHRGGWYKKELYLVLGKAKFGKTMFLLWSANAATWEGANVLYFTCETSNEILSDRLDAMNSNVEIRWLPQRHKVVADAIKAKKPAGKLYMYEYPTKTLTTAEIERVLRWHKMRGEDIHFVVTDYAGIMRSNRQYAERMDEDVAVLEDLRGLAGKHEIPVLTAGQTNKEGARKTITTGADMAGKMEQIAVVDGCLTLGGNEDDLKKGEMLIHMSEFRNSPTTTMRLKTSYNFGKFYAGFVATV